MASGGAFLEHYRMVLATADVETFVVGHESFVRELAVRIGDPLEDVDAGRRMGFIAFFSQCQRRYLALKERDASEEILGAANGNRYAVENMSNQFGRDVYDRVGDLRHMLRLRKCRNIVMVGCGAFPATLIWLSNHFPETRCTGIDVDHRCVEAAAQVTKAMRIENVQFETIDGSHYDFDGVDFVYVANQVIPKKAVLRQVGRSVSVSHVVVREPAPRGELLAEAVRYDLPSAFAIQGQGTESPTFLSYDLILRRA
jgi:16S rRNA G1207 methylase RsmC